MQNQRNNNEKKMFSIFFSFIRKTKQYTMKLVKIESPSDQFLCSEKNSCSIYAG